MKKLSILILMLIMAFSVQSVFAHHHTRNLQQEYHHYDFDNVPSDSKSELAGSSEEKVTSVLEAKKLGGSVHVKLKGKVSSKLGKETYLFKDNTGTVKVQIDDHDWKNVKADPKDTVIIEGQLKREQGGVIVEVDTIELAN